MTRKRFQQITSHFSALKIAVLGDFCLDRYLEIDPQKTERSIETGLPVHNVIRVRAYPGGAGTVVNNLCDLGVKRIWPIGFCGDDGEGFELRRALADLPVSIEHFLLSPLRGTFTYTKPLVVAPSQPPRELNRLDLKNWTPTPKSLEAKLVRSLAAVVSKIDALIVLDQVDRPGTGVVTRGLLKAVKQISIRNPGLIVLADSRRGLRGFPPVAYKMNRAELSEYLGSPHKPGIPEVKRRAMNLAKRTGQPVFITMAERGIVGALPGGAVEHAAAFPVLGAIDVVGAGDAVTANIVAALASDASLSDTLELAMSAASIVIHKLGVTGTASRQEIRRRLFADSTR